MNGRIAISSPWFALCRSGGCYGGAPNSIPNDWPPARLRTVISGITRNPIRS